MRFMRIFLLISLSVFSIHLSVAQVSFYNIYQNDEQDSEVFDIKALSDGSYVMAGITDKDGLSQVALSKIGCDGSLKWSKLYGNSSTINNVFSQIVEAENGDIVFVNNVGSFQNYNIVVARIKSDGTTVWKKRYGGNRDDIGRAIAPTPDGHFIVSGSTNSFGTDDSGSLSYYDLYYFKVNGETGDIIWTKTFGNNQSIEGGYSLTTDAMGNIYSTGRFLVGGTFYCYILKTDSEGNVLLFKGFGAPNHRTYGYDIKVENNGDIVLTGSTTIAKIDHTSLSDVFLIKTDSSGMPIFTNIYTPVVGNDNSESGSSIVLKADGGYGIGVPTMSFTNWTTGFVPNKNAVYSVDASGEIEKAILYNQGGSHYTRLRAAFDGGYILSNFSNYFSINFEFIPVIIKTDENFESGCNTIDVTNELALVLEIWDTQDISFTALSGGVASAHGPESSFEYSNVDVQCIEIPEIEAMFTSAPNIDEPFATFDFTNTSNGDGIYQWNFGDGNFSNEENPTYSYSSVGTFDVCLTLYANCDTSTTCSMVTVFELPNSIDELHSLSIETYPNPVTEILHLKTNQSFQGLQSFSILDINGRIVFEQKYIDVVLNNQIQISMDKFPEGLYFLQLKWQEGIISKKIFKSNRVE